MNIKKLILSIFIFTLTCNITASEVGYIDMQQLIQSLKSVTKFNSNLKDKEEEYQELYAKKEAQIEEAISKEKNQDKIQEMLAKAEEELIPKQQELAQLKMAFQTNLKLEIDTTSKKIAQEYGLD